MLNKFFTIVALTLLTICQIATAAQTDLDTEMNLWKNDLQFITQGNSIWGSGDSGSKARANIIKNEIIYSGVSDPSLFDLIQNRIVKLNDAEADAKNKGQTLKNKYIVYRDTLRLGLSSSGNDKYREFLSTQSDEKNDYVAKLDRFKEINPIIRAGVADVNGDKIKSKRLENIFNSNFDDAKLATLNRTTAFLESQPELKSKVELYIQKSMASEQPNDIRKTATFAYQYKLDSPATFKAMADCLESHYTMEKPPVEWSKALPHVARALGDSGNKEFMPLLENVMDSDAHRSVRKWAKKSYKQLKKL